ncbi:type II toxin-antitoxin system RelE/ParE family toxin [Parabacteroides sp.]
MKYYEDVKYMQEAKDFLRSLDSKARLKILYNISKVQYIKDTELFKKLDEDIWEFRTLYNKTYYRLLAFWDSTSETVIVCTHGFIKKSGKTPLFELEHAKELRKKYFDNNGKVDIT